MRIFKYILFFIFLLLFFISLPEIEELVNEDEEVKKEKETLLFFVGDIMLNRGVEEMIEEKGNGNFKFPFLNIAEELEKADILFGNLEGPISEEGLRVGGKYSFQFKEKSIEGLKYAGFDILSLANNHMLDYQKVSLDNTFNILSENDIDYVGAGLNEEEAFSLKKIENYEIGFIAFTDLCPLVWRASKNNSGIACIENQNEVIERIQDLKDLVDILIVSIHTGVEYKEEPSMNKESFFKRCIESGADLVVGHHSHVVQSVEEYKDGWIAYSLGNFVFDQGFSEETMESVILKVKIKKEEIVEVSSQKLKINNYFQPEILAF
jgi:poly-gamma-glutamate synthesis protein (capsule biosynthesis protein)